MGLFDRFKSGIDMKKIEAEYNSCKTVEEKENFIKMANEKLSKADAKQSVELDMMIKNLEIQVEQTKMSFAKNSIKQEKEMQEFGKKVDDLWNLPSQQKTNDIAKEMASSLIGDVELLKREEFNKKYAKIETIFSEASRTFSGYDEKNISFEDKYQTLFKIGVFRTIPKEYIQYAFLSEAEKERVLKPKEKELLNQIKNDPNYKEKLSFLYDSCVLAYDALGKYDVENEKLFPQISDSVTELKSVSTDLTRSIYTYIEKPEIFEAVQKDIEIAKKAKEVNNQVKGSYNNWDNFIENGKNITEIVLNPYFGVKLTEKERKLLNKWNSLKYRNLLLPTDEQVMGQQIGQIISKLTHEEQYLEDEFNSMCEVMNNNTLDTIETEGKGQR